MKRRDKFNAVRAELQSKGIKSAKRVLKRLSGRENRWMTDVNHCLSKTLVDKYGADTLSVLEDLTDVSFSEENLSKRNAKGRNETRSWTFYQLEQFLTYKARAAGSEVLKADRHHDTHEYVCNCCGYRSNDDRAGAMNIYQFGTMYASVLLNCRLRPFRVGVIDVKPQAITANRIRITTSAVRRMETVMMFLFFSFSRIIFTGS